MSILRVGSTLRDPPVPELIELVIVIMITEVLQ